MKKFYTGVVTLALVAGSYACGNKAPEPVVVPEPVVPEKTAEEIAAEQLAAQKVEWAAELDELKAKYTQNVADHASVWKLAEGYTGGPATADVIDKICTENGFLYLGLPPEYIRFTPLEPYFVEGKQANCSLIQPETEFYFGSLEPRIGELEEKLK